MRQLNMDKKMGWTETGREKERREIEAHTHTQTHTYTQQLNTAARRKFIRRS